MIHLKATVRLLGVEFPFMEQPPRKPRVTLLPARHARGALSVVQWAQLRLGMRDKSQRVQANHREDTGGPKKPHEAGLLAVPGTNVVGNSQP